MKGMLTLHLCISSYKSDNIWWSFGLLYHCEEVVLWHKLVDSVQFLIEKIIVINLEWQERAKNRTYIIHKGTSSSLSCFCSSKTSGVANLVYWVCSCYLLPVLIQPLQAPIIKGVPLWNNMLVSNIFYAVIIQ